MFSNRGALGCIVGAAMSSHTRHALKVIQDYLEGLNEAVQYSLTFVADLVTQTSSGVMGGIQAGSVPANHVVSDPAPTTFVLNATPASSSAGPLSLNLANGQLTATWTVDGTVIDVSGPVRCIETIAAPPSDRFLFVVEASTPGFYVLGTTNI
jgi:hypothetical protein